VLLTGASGFVGRRLAPALAAAGVVVRCVSRDAERAARRWPEQTWVSADLAHPDDLARALDGCRQAYYLVHSMAEPGVDFGAREVRLARAFAAAAAAAGLERIIYLGGVAPQGPPSDHLRSRLEVGAALRAGPVPTLELRAAMIVGSGSISWLIVRDLAARLPAMVLPRWLRSRSQPVAVDDVIIALTRARQVPLPISASYDLPGPDLLTGRAILARTARALGRRPPIMVELPVLTPALSSHWIRLVTRADWSVARELVLGLTHDLVARDDRFWALIQHPDRLSFAMAARRALEADERASHMATPARALEAAVARLTRPRRR